MTVYLSSGRKEVSCDFSNQGQTGRQWTNPKNEVRNYIIPDVLVVGLVLDPGTILDVD